MSSFRRRLPIVLICWVGIACGGDDSPGDGDACEAPAELCGGECVNTDNDPLHCGGCDLPCESGQVCGGGQCLDDCPLGTEDCDGTCAETESDPANCGACGNVCTEDEECRDSECQVRCDVGLNAPIADDPWGAQWDGFERSAVTLAEAAADCESFGARLPTVTELYRVSTVVSGAVGTAADVNPLWSLAPYDATDQVALSLADGSTTEVPAVNASSYRCVCAPPQPQGFRSSSCYGQPGSECLEMVGDGGRMNIDSEDRPALRKSSAIFECAFVGGRLASLNDLFEVITAGVTGSGAFLQTSDDATRSHMSSVAWEGNNPGTVLSDGTLDGTADPPIARIEDFQVESKRSFRCVGSRIAGAPSVASSELFEGSLYTIDPEDRSAAVWIDAVDACWTSGGHLPLSGELAQLIQQGLPSGSGSYIATGDGSRNSGLRSIVMRWTGVDTRFDYAYDDSGARDLNYYLTGSATPFRCMRYKVDSQYPGPSEDDCNGGCFEVSLPGSLATMWFDTVDRGSVSRHMDQVRTCQGAGGHVASSRDLAEAIRQGLPGGSNDEVRTSDTYSGDGDVNFISLRWVDAETTWSPADNNNTGGENENDSSVYRCVWTNELR